MKKYCKPNIEVNEYQFSEATASLNTWLSSNGLDEAGITTYVIQS